MRKRKRHRYIDLNLYRDFSESVTFESVWLDLQDRYHIRNIRQDGRESIDWLSMVLYRDYKYRLANYKSYIEPGMNARMMMELRNTAIFPIKIDKSFFSGVGYCDTPMEVVNYRAVEINKILETYHEEPWQYYFIVCSRMKPEVREFFQCDFEACYADGDPDKQLEYSDYVNDFIDAHLDGKDGVSTPIRPYSHPY